MPKIPWRLYLLPAAGWIALAVVGYAPTRSLGGPGAPAAMLTALAVVGAAVYATMSLAMRRFALAGGAARLRVGLTAGTVRFLLTLTIGALVAWRGTSNPKVFLVWLAISYVALILLETWVLVRWGKVLDKQL